MTQKAKYNSSMTGKYLKYKRKTLILLIVFFLVFAVTFALFHIPMKIMLYPAVICLLIGIPVLIVDYISVRRRHEILQNMEESLAEIAGNLPKTGSLNEEEYQKLMELLLEAQTESRNEAAGKYSNMVDYYTIWAHQIKTPIAAMRISIQNEDSDFARKMGADLNRIESYVEMVLTFLRLESDSTDYVIKEQELDRIIRGEIKKFSSEFIGRKLKLDFTPTDMNVVTDEKWLGFVIGQVISNALKYTGEGSISIYREDDCCLCIEDTGMGILPEDIPRIFENGFTGFRGREDRRASGIGLYLCRRICGNLGHSISAQSEPGKGTIITIEF